MLKQRFATGVTVCFVVFGILFFFPAWMHMFLLFAVFLLAQMEFADMVRGTGHRYEWFATTVLGVLFLGATALETPLVRDLMERFPWTPPPMPAGRIDFSALVLCLAPAVLLALGVLRRRTERAMETFALSFAGFWYVAVLLSFLVRLAFEWKVYEDWHTNYTGRLMLLLFVVLVKSADIGGYAFGRLFGRHKLVPAVSPAKTWEGLLGCYVFSLLAGLATWYVFHAFFREEFGQIRFPLVHALVLPVLLATTGLFGDLAESLIKRSVGVKDSSSRFPGMGGILDILDSLLFSAPFMYAYVIWFFAA